MNRSRSCGQASARRPPQGATFEPETVKTLCDAYDQAMRDLHDKGPPQLAKELIARRILILAEKGERDRNRLCAGALGVLLSERH